MMAAARWVALGPCVVATVGIIMVVVSSVSFPLANWLIKNEIIKRVQLVNGTDAFDLWRKPNVPIYLQVWVFHLQNAEVVSNGGKPDVVERGPYTYREVREKVDLCYHDNGTVTYRQIKTYHFVREKSIGWDNDTFTSINIPYMTLVSGMRWKSKAEQTFLSWLLNVFFKKEEVFVTRPVREVVWGYTDPILHFAKSVDAKKYPTDFIGVLAGKNNTDDGHYTVFSGIKNISLLGVIDNYNGKRYVDYWSTPYANMVNGTDGTIGPPFINKSLVVEMFSTDICRSVYGTYHGEVTTLEDITLYRFTSPRAAMEAPSENPNNAGFCVPLGNCMRTGVLNISTCQIIDSYHLPIMASAPHFYMADQKYINGVTNMRPDPQQHATNIDIEPNTGFVMQVAKRLQINVYLEAFPEFSKTANLPTVVHPVLWLNESAATDESHAQLLRNQLLVPMKIIQIAQYIMLALGGVVLCSSIIFVTGVSRCKQKTTGPISGGSGGLMASDPALGHADDTSLLPAST